jgi:RNA polymerase sigma-70 factor (ECF subfamily)
MTASDPSAPCDPRELIRLARANDPQALDRATRCHGERLLAVGRRYCRTSDEAHDAVQDALLAAGEHLDQFRGEGSVEGWLVRMVTHACSRMRRGRKNAPALHDTEVVLASAAEGPEALVGRGEVAIALGRALTALAPRDRTILLLAETEDWTAPEIAERLAMSPGAVRTRLSRARARVRQELAALDDTLRGGDGS